MSEASQDAPNVLRVLGNRQRVYECVAGVRNETIDGNWCELVQV